MPAQTPTVVLATPFRLFFLLAGVYAAAWIPLWVSVFEGRQLATSLGSIGWHAHEITFGYTGAVLAGFLLTAARAWTGRATVGPLALLALLMVWCAGRAASLYSAHLPAAVPLVVDGTFWFAVAAGTARAVVPACSTRNLAFPPLVLVLGAADLVFQLHSAGIVAPGWSARSLDVGLDAIVLVIVIFGGRIIPLFTGNALERTSSNGSPPRREGLVDWLGLGMLWVLIACRAASPPAALIHGLAVAAGLVNAVRLWGWRGCKTLRSPILWVLHLGWLFLSASIALRGVAGFTSAVPPGLALHLQTVGGIGLLTLGMMTRVSLGHTGRPLVVHPLVVASYAALVAATLVRVVVPWVDAALYFTAVRTSGPLWALAFVLFTVRYAPILLTPRADGKPG